MGPEDLFLSNPPEFYQVLSGLLGQEGGLLHRGAPKETDIRGGFTELRRAEAVKELKERELDKISRILSRREEVMRGWGRCRGMPSPTPILAMETDYSKSYPHTVLTPII